VEEDKAPWAAIFFSSSFVMRVLFAGNCSALIRVSASLEITKQVRPLRSLGAVASDKGKRKHHSSTTTTFFPLVEKQKRKHLLLHFPILTPFPQEVATTLKPPFSVVALPALVYHRCLLTPDMTLPLLTQRTPPLQRQVLPTFLDWIIPSPNN